MTTPRITLIAALAQQRAIGRGNALPWHLPEDLQHFKRTTLGHTVIMGRRTFESIGRPLPGRRTVVLSQHPDWHAPGCEHARSISAALSLCATEPEVFIAGGATVYEQALPLATRLLLTHIDLNIPDADAYFPPWPSTLWQLCHQSAHDGRTGLHYTLEDWRRVSAPPPLASDSR